MDAVLLFVVGALKITLLDLTLCGDNIGIIALATKNLPDKYAKKASMIGIAGAIGLRVIFACAITLILTIQWLPIKLIGGIILVKITWDFVTHQQEEDTHAVKSTNKFWEAVFVIIIADISMSLDNVLAIASAADGSVGLIVFGILLNVPIIFFGSQLVVNLMKKHAFIIYIGGAVLAHTSINMILEDPLAIKYLNLPHLVSFILPWAAAIITLIYGHYKIKRTPKKIDVFIKEGKYRKKYDKKVVENLK